MILKTSMNSEVKDFYTTLSEIANSDLILLFVDASDDLSTIVRKVAAAEKIMKGEAPDIPIVVCANKIDLTTNEHLKQVTELLRNVHGFHVIEISSTTGDKLDMLLEAVHEAIVGLEIEHATRKISRCVSPSLL